MRQEKKTMAVFLAGAMLISSILLPASMEGKSKKPALNKKEITTTIGKTVKVKVKKAKGYKITWKSTKKKLATVKKAGKYAAKIKAKKSGTVKIIAKVKKGSRKYNLTCKVKIKKGKTPTTTPIPTGGQSTDISASTLPQESAAAPTASSAANPSDNPGVNPSDNPSAKPSDNPSTNPSDNPSAKPSNDPSANPSDNPSAKPTNNPSANPSDNPSAKPTNNPSANPSDNPSAKPSENPSVKPSEETQLALTKDTLCAFAGVVGTPTYNEDGSITVTLTNKDGGGGIGFYIDPSKANVDLSNFSHIKFDVKAEDESTPLTFQYHVSSDFWKGSNVITYGNVGKERTTFTYELGEINNALGFGLRYNAYASTGNRTLTIYSITLIPDEKDITEAMSYTSLAELASAYNLKMGTVMNMNKVVDQKYKDLTKHHFNSITAANEMKAYSLLDQNKSKTASDGMPEMDYTNADKIMAYAQKNGIKVRGHALVWDAGMCDWFFRKGYDSNGNYVDQETVKNRVKSYIRDVVTHFEKNYPGVIYCWDVVNEAVDPNNKKDSSDPRCIENNIFTERMGSDYVELSFQYTQEVLDDLHAGGDVSDADAIKLYYNDFSTYDSKKCQAICELVKSINKNGKKLCDGVGMQCYIGAWTGGTSNTTPVTDDSSVQKNSMNEGDIAAIEAAIKNFGACGVEVQITEMAVRNWSDSAVYKKKHAEFCGKLMTKFLELAQGNGSGFNPNKPLTAISIWGLYDDPDLPVTDYSYSMNGTRCGLFTETCAVKDSFKSVYEVLGGTVSGQ